MRTMLIGIGVCAFLVAGCGGASVPPEISALEFPSAIRRGLPTSGSFVVTDADGFSHLALRVHYAGPAEGTFELPMQIVGETEQPLSTRAWFTFVLLSVAPAGTYDLVISVVDEDGQESNPLPTTIVVE